MRSVSLCLRAGLVTAALLFSSAGAGAQSFLQNLFGLGGSSAPPARYAPERSGPPIILRQGPSLTREHPRYSPSERRTDAAQDGGEEGATAASGSGIYRTVCVRACDGYYFPISNGVRKARFMRDAAQCRASCGPGASLFYLPAGSDNTSTMLDLAGRSYLRMPNAFKYRKTLIDGCSCKPMPWSEAEVARHRQYAAEQALAEANQKHLAEAAAARAEAVNSKPTSQSGGASYGSEPKSQTGQNAVAEARQEPAADPRSATAAAAPEQGSEVAAQSGSNTAADPVGAPYGPRAPALVRRGDRGNPAVALINANASATARQTPPRPQRQAAVRQAQSQGQGQGQAIGWFPSGQTKYTWPGDAPRR